MHAGATGGVESASGASGVGPVATPTAGAEARTSSALVAQLDPALTRLATRGEGVHRLVLRLHPADLGELQVTVTVRNGTVDVTVAAAAEARDLLLEGSSEIRALLDGLGRGAGSVVFKDLPGAGSAPTPVFPQPHDPAGRLAATEAGLDWGDPGRSGSGPPGREQAASGPSQGRATSGRAGPAADVTTDPVRRIGTTRSVLDLRL
jgi:hypothetical protein